MGHNQLTRLIQKEQLTEPIHQEFFSRIGFELYFQFGLRCQFGFWQDNITKSQGGIDKKIL